MYATKGPALSWRCRREALIPFIRSLERAIFLLRGKSREKGNARSATGVHRGAHRKCECGKCRHSLEAQLKGDEENTPEGLKKERRMAKEVKEKGTRNEDIIGEQEFRHNLRSPFRRIVEKLLSRAIFHSLCPRILLPFLARRFPFVSKTRRDPRMHV